jgi:hypothetical protein
MAGTRWTQENLEEFNASFDTRCTQEELDEIALAKAEAEEIALKAALKEIEIENAAEVPKTYIIGLAGLARSGKDTVAELLLAERFFFPFLSTSFALPMKEMIYAGLGLKDKENDKALELYGKSYRHIAQTIGTEWGRKCIHPDLWLNITANRCTGLNTIITDVRFENEAEFVRANGILVHVNRHDQQHVEESFHTSEAGVTIKHDDYKILNCGSLEDLRITCRHAAIDLEEGLKRKDRKKQELGEYVFAVKGTR